MTMKMNVGITRKIGLPNFCSAGASCHIDVELDPALLSGDPGVLHQRVQSVLKVCRQVVADELASQSRRETQQMDRGQTSTPPRPANREDLGRAEATAFREVSPPVSEHRRPSAASPPRPATAAQVKALHAIAGRLGLALSADLQREFGVRSPQQLTLAQASQMIDRLKATLSPQPA